MILRRIAVFIGLLVGLCATQVPEFVEQYRQRLGGAVAELARVVARFEADAAGQKLTAGEALGRLAADRDPLAQQRGAAAADDMERLGRLRQAQAALRNATPIDRIGALATHLDPELARGTLADFAPAIPTGAEGITLGLVGFVAGTFTVRATGRLFRQRLKAARA
jgi:hypothetical protein